MRRRKAIVALASEQAIAGGLLYCPEAADGLDLDPRDFTDPTSWVVVDTILALRSRGEVVDYSTVLAELEQAGRCLRMDELAALVAAAPSTRSLQQHARRVRKASERRRLAERMAMAAEDATDPSVTDERLHANVERIAAECAPQCDAARWLRLSEVNDTEVTWFWDGRIPNAEYSQIVGPDGAGKTALAVYLASRVTTGRTLHGNAARMRPRGVVWIGGEEGPSKVKRRLGRAGAELSSVFMPSGGESWTTSAAGIAALRSVIEQNDVALVVIDPIVDAAEGDDWRSKDVRRAMLPLISLAHEMGVVVIGLRHWGKTAREARSRASGSHSWRDLCRASMQVAEHDGKRVITWDKVSDADKPVALAFVLEDVGGDPVLGILGEQPGVTADDVTSAAPQSADERSIADEADGFLRDELGPTPGRDAQEVRKRARAAGITDNALRRSRERLRVEIHRVRDAAGRVTASMWSLPSRVGRDEGTDGEIGHVAPVPVHRSHLSPPSDGAQMETDGRQPGLSIDLHHRRIHVGPPVHAREREPGEDDPDVAGWGR